MDGFFYDIDYKRLIHNNNYFNDYYLKNRTKRLVVKPSVDGMSGFGVHVFEYQLDGGGGTIMTHNC